METIYIAAGASLAAGIIGYIISYFWLRPIWRYRRIKEQLILDLKGPQEQDGDSDSEAQSENHGISPSEIFRHHSVALSESFLNDLPPWYRMILANRGESPLDASASLMRLANTKNTEHVEKRIREIRLKLKLDQKK